MNIICKKHGDTLAYHPSGRTNPRCSKCSSEAVSRRRKKLKIQAVAYKGGKCSECGYDRCVEALCFHHTDPTQKDFNIAKSGHTRSWARMVVELDKCVLLCHNCHSETHSKLDLKIV